MPISCSLPQANGSIVTYVVFQGCSMNGEQATAQAVFTGYADQDHYVNNAPSLATLNYDASVLVTQPPVEPSLPTFGEQIADTMEKYVLMLAGFEGAAQVAAVAKNPLSP